LAKLLVKKRKIEDLGTRHGITTDKLLKIRGLCLLSNAENNRENLKQPLNLDNVQYQSFITLSIYNDNLIIFIHRFTLTKVSFG
jgi:hypothetical protein